MEHEIYHDETYNRAMKFVDNFKTKHNGVSNLYVFTSVDKDGNIVDEKYGMNLMTNTGFSAIYASGNSFAASDSVKLYVGSGNGNIAVTDSRLESPLFGGLAATNSDTSKSYKYPMYYSKGENDGEGLITLISRFMICYYDYNITNYSEEYRISEYGIGTSSTNIWTHSHVYDMQGNLASMLKTPNERLVITVYMCLSFYEHVIMNGWSNNRFTAITRNDIMYNRMRDSNLYTYKRGNKKKDRTGSPQRTMDTSNNNVYINSTILPSFTMYDGSADESGYFDGFIFYCSGMMIVEPQFLDNPETIELTNYWSKDSATYSGFADKFGMYPSSDYTKEQWPQFTHFFEANAYLYDWKSRSWSNKLDIYNPDGKWYDETPSQTTCALPIYYSNNGEILTGYLYQNIRPDDKILKIKSGGITIYATNKYWANTSNDNNTDPNNGWVWIRDYENIPENCKTARYWITNTNSDSLSFVRESDCFQLLEKGTGKNGYESYPEFEQKYYIAPQCDNYEYGWYKRDNIVYVPSTRQTYTIGNSGAQSSETMTYDKWLINFNSVNNKVIVADMSNATSGTVTPQDTDLLFSGTVNALTQTYRTETGTGLICVQSTNTEETVVFNMLQGTFDQSVHAWKRAACIWGTKKVAYIPAGTGDNNIYIFNYETNSVEGNPIPFPEGMTDVPFMFGHTNFLWFTDGSTFGYVVDLRTDERTCVGFEYNMPYKNELYRVKMTCVDDVFIVYNFNECGSNQIQNAHYIRLDNPTVSSPMTDFNADVSSGYIGGRIDFILRYVQKGTNDDGTSFGSIFLLIVRGYSNNNSSTPNGTDNRMIDFGQYLATGNVKLKVHSTNSSLANYVMYGENLIHRSRNKVPIMNYMPIKLTGKTDTIGTMNYIKNVSGKSWLISYTNTPTWGYEVNGKGVPPGVPLAKTDKDGTITGWS